MLFWGKRDSNFFFKDTLCHTASWNSLLLLKFNRFWREIQFLVYFQKIAFSQQSRNPINFQLHLKWRLFFLFFAVHVPVLVFIIRLPMLRFRADCDICFCSFAQKSWLLVSLFTGTCKFCSPFLRFICSKCWYLASSYIEVRVHISNSIWMHSVTFFTPCRSRSPLFDVPYFTLVYVKTHMRFLPYMVGVITGVIFYDNMQEKRQYSKVINLTFSNEHHNFLEL